MMTLNEQLKVANTWQEQLGIVCREIMRRKNPCRCLKAKPFRDWTYCPDCGAIEPKKEMKK